MIGPEKVYKLSCISCEYREGVICRKLDRILIALTYDTPLDCPYIISNDVDNESIDTIIDKLKQYDGVYYEQASSYDDPVLRPTDGLVHIYDLRKYEGE